MIANINLQSTQVCYDVLFKIDIVKRIVNILLIFHHNTINQLPMFDKTTHILFRQLTTKLRIYPCQVLLINSIYNLK